MEVNAYMNGLVRQFGRARRALWLAARAAAVLMMVLGAFGTARPAAAEALQCSEHTLQVRLAEGAAETYNVVGTLCSEGPAAGKTVQLLLHGATYARYYWDFPYQNDHYSYVSSATKRGYATFNLDRIGNGNSDHPDGNLVDLNANGYVVLQVVQALRDGKIASTPFEKVIVVGHSMGSFSAINFASRFPGNADGIILTGFVHDVDWTFFWNTLYPTVYPTQYDPKFAQFPYPNYLTTQPGTRGGDFFYLPNVDPALLAVDENLKQTVSMGELVSFFNAVYDQSSKNVVGPVQIVIGQYDSLFCGDNVNHCSDEATIQNYEQTFFGPSACLETAMISDAGHDLNLHLNANAAYSKMLSWADRYVGSTAAPAPVTCAP